MQARQKSHSNRESETAQSSIFHFGQTVHVRRATGDHAVPLCRHRSSSSEFSTFLPLQGKRNDLKLGNDETAQCEPINRFMTYSEVGLLRLGLNREVVILFDFYRILWIVAMSLGKNKCPREICFLNGPLMFDLWASDWVRTQRPLLGKYIHSKCTWEFQAALNTVWQEEHLLFRKITTYSYLLFDYSFADLWGPIVDWIGYSNLYLF